MLFRPVFRTRIPETRMGWDCIKAVVEGIAVVGGFDTVPMLAQYPINVDSVGKSLVFGLGRLRGPGWRLEWHGCIGD